MKQQWKELEKSKLIQLINKCLSSTGSAEQEAPPPTFLVLGEVKRTYVEQTPVAQFDARLGWAEQLRWQMLKRTTAESVALLTARGSTG